MTTKKDTKYFVIEKSPQERYLCYNDMLGRGAFKVVYRAYDTHNGIEVAWNSIFIGKLSDEYQKKVMKEIKILKSISAENEYIVEYKNAWVNLEKQCVVLITEIALSGNLSEYINKIKKINMKVIKKWGYQILTGLNFLHKKNITHRDLKCNNIFINSNTANIRIGDFGLAEKSKHTLHSVIGTPEYMAPEMYEENYDEKVDIYAFGMCMLEMITKDTPYSDCDTIASIYKKVESGILPDAVKKVKNDEAADIILQCITYDPKLRPTAEELLMNPFFNTIQMDDLKDDLVVEEDDNKDKVVEEEEILPEDILDTKEEIDPALISVISDDKSSNESSKIEHSIIIPKDFGKRSEKSSPIPINSINHINPIITISEDLDKSSRSIENQNGSGIGKLIDLTGIDDNIHTSTDPNKISPFM